MGRVKEKDPVAHVGNRQGKICQHLHKQTDFKHTKQ